MKDIAGEYRDILALRDDLYQAKDRLESIKSAITAASFYWKIDRDGLVERVEETGRGGF